MAQRCSYCGRTKKQHYGLACVDILGFKRVLGEAAEKALSEGKTHTAVIDPNGQTVKVHIKRARRPRSGRELGNHS